MLLAVGLVSFYPSSNRPVGSISQIMYAIEYMQNIDVFNLYSLVYMQDFLLFTFCLLKCLGNRVVPE